MMDLIDQSYELMLPNQSIIVLNRHNVTPEQYKRAAFKNNKISIKNMGTLLDLFGELLFTEGIHKVAKIQVEKSSAQTYVYQFSYDPGYSLIKSKALPIKGLFYTVTQ